MLDFAVTLDHRRMRSIFMHLSVAGDIFDYDRKTSTETAGLKTIKINLNSTSSTKNWTLQSSCVSTSVLYHKT